MADENKPVVFCVDDELPMLAWMEATLSDLGWELRSESDAQKALDAVRRAPPDLILLDVAMPKMDGYQLCESLRESPETASIPVVFLTGLAGDWERSRAFLVGAVDYLAKPITEEALVRAVRAHLETRRLFEGILRLVERPVPVNGRTAGRWDDPFGPAGFARFKTFLRERHSLPAAAAGVLSRLLPDALYAGTAELGLSARQVAEAMSEFFPLPILPRIHPGQIRTGVLPPRFCFAHHVLAVGDPTEPPSFAASNPFSWEVLEAIRQSARGAEPWIYVAEPSSFDSLQEWYSAGSFRRAGPA